MQQWQQELTQSIRTFEQLERYLTIENKEVMRAVVKNMRLSITPHTLKLIDFSNPQDPLFLMSVPTSQELNISPEELRDPIGDEEKSPIPFLTHRYPDRVLIYPTFSCAHYCRFCFRRFKTGQANPGPTPHDLERIYDYLHSHPEIDEAILTGGDPLTLLDEQFLRIIQELRRVQSIHRLRIHTRVPVNLPSRITPELIHILRAWSDPTHPVFVVTHFNHPRELASENIEAIARLVDAGIVVRNQSVLLKGVNDDVATLAHLFKQLTNVRALPYYLHQLDLARGTNHFRVPIENGIELMRQLQGNITGLAIPRYVLDIPQGKGKIPLLHPFLQKNESGYEAEDRFGTKWDYTEPTL